MKKQGIKIFLLATFLIGSTMSCTSESVNTDCTPTSVIGDKTSKDEDNAVLTQLFKEIESLSNSKTCDNAGQWLFTPIGAKACGGPSGYIAYSSQIDVACFLKKVEHYTAQTKKYNTKHGIISDCMISPSPKNVSCENGKPVLVY
ncbi:hypothetical protein GCM10011514_38930 [Emticicia aquatilis]|uniref:Lipoprotein n=1 Tax=Emticicia aquatilis TaxID=1537369 RepID=A0A916Z1B0_9BACT|nr:hypothetical protein [Emticicia aquatilis]GGD71055.1 hypothetical protein GCM10011514_38930 [Emticicia aquatilis]